MNVKQAIESAKHLNAQEKALVVRCFISSLKTRQNKGVDQAWGELAEKSFASILSGKAEAVPWEVINQRVKG